MTTVLRKNRKIIKMDSGHLIISELYEGSVGRALLPSQMSTIAVGEYNNKNYIFFYAPIAENYSNRIIEILNDEEMTGRDEINSKNTSLYLLELRAMGRGSPNIYKEMLKEIIGGKNGVMGTIMDFPSSVLIQSEECTEILVRSSRWWGRLRDKSHRCSRIHKEFSCDNIWWKNRNIIITGGYSNAFGDYAEDVSMILCSIIYLSLECKKSLPQSIKRICTILYDYCLCSDAEIKNVMPFYIAYNCLKMTKFLLYDKKEENARTFFNMAYNLLSEEEFDIEFIKHYMEAPE